MTSAKFVDESVLTRPHFLPVTLKQVEGHPIVITESCWVPPLSYQSEGPMLIAACQSLNGVGAYFWFMTSEERWSTWTLTVMVVSMDGQPLASSGKILVQVGTRERTTGWATRPAKIKVDDSEVAGEEVTSFGHAPWQIENADITLTVKNGRLSKATVLDCNGIAASEAAPTRDATGVQFAFPPDALYLVLH